MLQTFVLPGPMNKTLDQVEQESKARSLQTYTTINDSVKGIQPEIYLKGIVKNEKQFYLT